MLQTAIFLRAMTNGGQLFQQCWQRRLHRVPYHVEVDLEISMSDAVAHSTHAAPWNFRILITERCVPIHHLRCSLSNDDETHDDCLLGAFVSLKLFLAQPIDKSARIGSRLPHVITVVGQAVSVIQEGPLRAPFRGTWMASLPAFANRR